MKISTKGRYGLRALVDLTIHSEGRPVTLPGIAERQNLSLNYLEQVFAGLRKAGIVKSVKGPNGGYVLSKDPECITIQEVLYVLEGEFSIAEHYGEGGGDSLQQALNHLVWQRIDGRVNGLLERTTLLQLAYI